MKQMTLEEISKAAASGAFRKIPVSREIYSDIRTPVETLKVLQGVSSHCYMLESVEDKKQWGRYTFLGYDPSLELTCVNGNLTITADAAEMKKVEDIPESCKEQLPTGQIRLTAKTAHPGAVIKTLIEKNKSPKIATLPTFTGGLVGYFSYDYIKYSEPTLKLDAEDQEHFKDVDLMLFDKVIAYDNYRQKIVLMINIETENLEENYVKAVQELEKMEELIRFGKPAETKAGHLKSEFRPLFDEKAYCEKVEQVKHYIHEGDLFQLVLSNRLEADFEGSLLDTYRVLRTTNPSPYMFYFSSDDVEIAGASPETLVKVEDGEVRTFPLAGTRSRGKSYEEDQRLEKELFADEKERAEHNMLVDLGRNDLGKICDFGTVEVEKYMSIERYSHVMHIGSTVKGQLRKDKTAVDAIDSVLPAEPSPVHQSSVPARSSTSWKTTSAAFTAVRSAIWISPEIWTPASRSGLRLRKTEKCSSAPAPHCSRQRTGKRASGMHQQSKGRDGRTCRGRRRKQLMILLVDNYDSFSYNLYQLAGSINPDMKVIRNDEMTINEIRALAPASIILSPGPGRPEQAGRCMEIVEKLGGEIPILGVCLGHQAICAAYGATVTYAKQLMHGKQSETTLDLTSELFQGLPETVPVARYHSLAADEATLPETLKVTARTADGEVMAVEDSEKKIYGVQFHPESILTPQGRQMVENFLKITR